MGFYVSYWAHFGSSLSPKLFGKLLFLPLSQRGIEHAHKGYQFNTQTHTITHKRIGKKQQRAHALRKKEKKMEVREAESRKAHMQPGSGYRWKQQVRRTERATHACLAYAEKHKQTKQQQQYKIKEKKVMYRDRTPKGGSRRELNKLKATSRIKKKIKNRPIHERREVWKCFDDEIPSRFFFFRTSRRGDSDDCFQRTISLRVFARCRIFLFLKDQPRERGRERDKVFFLKCISFC